MSNLGGYGVGLKDSTSKLNKWMNIDSFNSEVSAWSDKVVNAMRTKAAAISGHNKHVLLKYLRKRKTKYGSSLHDSLRVKLENSIGGSLHRNLYKRFGSIERIGFGFASHGIFIALGIYGKDQGIKRKAKGNPSKNGPLRDPIDWFNSVLSTHVDELAEIIARYESNAVVDSTKMLIN